MEVYLGERDTIGCVLVQYFLVVANHGERELVGKGKVKLSLCLTN
jgi:hypothetical protein